LNLRFPSTPSQSSTASCGILWWVVRMHPGVAAAGLRHDLLGVDRARRGAHSR
jgi:hypothetical protein